MDQEWLKYLKEHKPDLYIEAKDYIDKLKLDLEKKEIVVERYRNLIACNGFFDGI